MGGMWALADVTTPHPQQLFPAGTTMCCCAVPCRGAVKGGIFALALGYRAAKEQSLFSQALTNLAMLILSLGAPWALQTTFTWCSGGISWSPSWISSYTAEACFQNRLIYMRPPYINNYIQAPPCQNPFEKCKLLLQITADSGWIYCHIQSLQIVVLLAPFSKDREMAVVKILLLMEVGIQRASCNGYRVWPALFFPDPFKFRLGRSLWNNLIHLFSRWRELKFLRLFIYLFISTTPTLK